MFHQYNEILISRDWVDEICFKCDIPVFLATPIINTSSKPKTAQFNFRVIFMFEIEWDIDISGVPKINCLRLSIYRLVKDFPFALWYLEYIWWIYSFLSEYRAHSRSYKNNHLFLYHSTETKNPKHWKKWIISKRVNVIANVRRFSRNSRFKCEFVNFWRVDAIFKLIFSNECSDDLSIEILFSIQG